MSRLDKLYIGTNTKMFKSIKQTDNYLKELEELTADIPKKEIEIFVLPSFTSLINAKKIVGSSIKIGAQNMCWENEGQFTGEVSPVMLNELNLDIVMSGHSERRSIFLESDEIQGLKVYSSIKNGFISLLCIGETEEEKNYHVADERIRIQLKKALNKIDLGMADKLWIAYEPVWAIGVNGKPAKPEYINSRHTSIKKCLIDIFGDKVGSEIPVLYGGSVNRKNSTEIIAIDNVDGLFIGRSAWNAKEFNLIIRDTLEIFSKRKIARS